MTKKKKPATANKLKLPEPIKPLPGGRKLCPTSVPAIPPGKFAVIDGQLDLFPLPRAKRR